MSYCRWRPGSDLYIFDDVTGGITCCGCSLFGDFNTEDPAEMAEHVAQHKRAGHDVLPGIEEEFRRQASAPAPLLEGAEPEGGKP